MPQVKNLKYSEFPFECPPLALRRIGYLLRFAQKVGCLLEDHFAKRFVQVKLSTSAPSHASHYLHLRAWGLAFVSLRIAGHAPRRPVLDSSAGIHPHMGLDLGTLFGPKPWERMDPQFAASLVLAHFALLVHGASGEEDIPMFGVIELLTDFATNFVEEFVETVSIELGKKFGEELVDALIDWILD